MKPQHGAMRRSHVVNSAISPVHTVGCMLTMRLLTALDHPPVVPWRQLMSDAYVPLHVYVGPDCYRRVIACDAAGYQPPRGGQPLFPLREKC